MQSIFSAPSRRRTAISVPASYRRAATLKMLCIIGHSSRVVPSTGRFLAALHVSGRDRQRVIRL
jgi:hypothetical protein